MARIRTIKPEFWEDEKMSDVPMLARLLFIGTWNFADDYGVILNSPKYLRSKIFPYDESLRDSQIKEWLDALTNARMLIPFQCKEKSYLYIRTFMSHQIIDKRYTKTILPDGYSAENILAGLGLCQNTTSSHSDDVVFTQQEEEREMEEEVERKRKTPRELVIFPFTSGEFGEKWELWKKFKRQQFSFVYKSPITEQAALKMLADLANGDESTALAIIDQSINFGWKGFFELKTKENGRNGNRKEGTIRPILAAAHEVLRRASGKENE